MYKQFILWITTLFGCEPMNPPNSDVVQERSQVNIQIKHEKAFGFKTGFTDGLLPDQSQIKN